MTIIVLNNNCPSLTVSNILQCDQPKEGLVNSPSRMDEYCKEGGYSGWFETSAKENINVDEAAKFLVNQVSTRVPLVVLGGREKILGKKVVYYRHTIIFKFGLCNCFNR